MGIFGRQAVIRIARLPRFRSYLSMATPLIKFLSLAETREMSGGRFAAARGDSGACFQA